MLAASRFRSRGLPERFAIRLIVALIPGAFGLGAYSRGLAESHFRSLRQGPVGVVAQQ